MKSKTQYSAASSPSPVRRRQPRLRPSRFYGAIITEADDGGLQILAIGPEALVEDAAWVWARKWVKRHQPEGAIRLTVWSEAVLASEVSES